MRCGCGGTLHAVDAGARAVHHKPVPADASSAIPLDLLIIGGGAAGLFLLDAAHRSGRRCLLIESFALGHGQTVCAQGIIHGGLKYTLDGLLHPSAQAIREMPDHWRECLAGRRAPDLHNTRIRAEQCHLWRTDSLRSRLGMIGASVGLRVAPRKVAADERPDALADVPGTVATVAEPVIDPCSLLMDLASQHHERLLLTKPLDDSTVVKSEADRRIRLRAAHGDALREMVIAPQHIALTVGASNADLARLFIGKSPIAQQRRPLHMVMMRGNLPPLNGHCVDGARTRVTITSDIDTAGRTIWQVGGQLAEEGVTMTEADLIRHAREEIQAVLPGLDLTGVEWSTYRVDRAEPATSSGARPEDAFAEKRSNVIIAWPTKLALAPRLALKILELLDPPSAAIASDSSSIPADWPRPTIASPPWETATSWSTAP